MGNLLKRGLLLAVVVAVCGLVAYVTAMPVMEKQASGRRARVASGGAPVPVMDAAARTADVPVYFNGVGTAKARNTVTVRPQVDGKLLSVSFKEGQDVKRGDLLAKIDPATYQAQLDQAIAKKSLDEAQLANAQRDLERYSKLTTLSVAEKTIDTQRALVAQLTAQIKLDDAAVSNARTVLDYTIIRSPLDGRTGIRMIDEGNLVRGSDASSGLVVITEVKPIGVMFTLPQQQLVRVNSAMAKGPVVVEVFNTDGKVLLDTGTLQVVDNQVDSTTGTVRMKAELPNADLQLWPGQFVNVRVLVDTLKQVVVIPTPAVQRGPNGAFAYVVLPDETVGLRPLTVGLQTETIAVVEKGVAATERVVTTGFARLKDGARVVVAPPEDQTPTPGTSAPPAAKADGRAKVRAACAEDIQKFCANVDRSALRGCLRSNAPKLSETCKVAAMATAGNGKPREADARKLEGSSTQ